MPRPNPARPYTIPGFVTAGRRARREGSPSARISGIRSRPPRCRPSTPARPAPRFRHRHAHHPRARASQATAATAPGTPTARVQTHRVASRTYRLTASPVLAEPRAPSNGAVVRRMTSRTASRPWYLSSFSPPRPPTARPPKKGGPSPRPRRASSFEPRRPRGSLSPAGGRLAASARGRAARPVPPPWRGPDRLPSKSPAGSFGGRVAARARQPLRGSLRSLRLAHLLVASAPSSPRT